ncbi:M14 family metallocarboxypeptidase [Solimonas sp. SE-A11]|uniref:M14 family metallopeptidase n=1 Tax=Solimonas sp. SE-A11 TaxID=3054954 RepID=UPI00259CC695|nr:M14 family metallocarboxypeptidase [Solimonas sp. SE-A11]MDM4768773.1 M14 family metallocarboxypeptidase [Solimonas sp. SE-A11]
MTALPRSYPIGTPGTPWGEAEKTTWFSRQQHLRSYEADVLGVIRELEASCTVAQYGQLEYGARHYPLYSLKSAGWRPELPVALITGGVHGYETSGVHGALRFALGHLHRYEGRLNILVVPCVSPWGYETIQRWNPDALDPNRSFRENSPAGESAALLRLLASVRERVLLHIDLHETTDTDESEFRPALAARDGVAFVPDVIPDGFYLVDDTDAPRTDFQSAIIDAVAKVTHIAPSDPQGRIIGAPVVAPGVIRYPLKPLGLCAGITDAAFRTTTEVYPDSPNADPEGCILAQVTAVGAAIDFALAHE